MTKKLNLTFIDNEVHGYLKVSKNTFFDLGLNGSEFSSYSFYGKETGFFYLEEDCDAPKFMKIASNKGYNINLNRKHVSYNPSTVIETL